MLSTEKSTCRVLAVFAVMSAASPVVVAQSQQEPVTWRLCALDFVRDATDLGNLRLDVPIEKLGPNAGPMARLIESDGVAAAGLAVHAVWAKCTEPLARQGPPTDPEEKKASECAAAAVVRLTALSRMRKGDALAAVQAGVPGPMQQSIAVLYGLAKDWSFGKAVWASVESGVACVDAAARDN